MKKIFSRVMRGVETTRSVLFNLFFLLFITFLVISIMNAQPSLPDKFILQLNLQGSLVEQVKRPEFGLTTLTAPSPQQVKVHDVVTALKRAAQDERVLAVRLNLEKLNQAPLVHLQSIRQAIEVFKSSGKPVMAYADSWSQGQYYLAAAAHHVFLHPMGHITLNGYSLYRNYVRDALDKLSIDIQVFKAGRYKSAAAPFIQSAMSDDERRANQAWLNTLWDVYKEDLQHMRGIEPSRLQQVLDHPVPHIQQHHGDLAQLFVQENWVDGLRYADQADTYLKERVGDVQDVEFKDYLMASGDGFGPPQPETSDDWVAIITGSGTILQGDQPAGTIGSDNMVALLQTALDDERIKAVVLRLNTPGGSASAAESIRHAVERLKQAGKPVVVSMGSMAASGGYWIASAANEIWASKATLTGSIGVFGIVPNISRSLKHLGIQTDGLGTTAIAGTLRLDKPLTPILKQTIQMGINQTYHRFIQLVAAGRLMDIKEVEKVAQGRVWSGLDAQQLGLVDHLGDIHDAILAAATLAHIEDKHEAITLDPPINTMELIIENLFSQVVIWVSKPQPQSQITNIIQSFQQQLQHIQQLNDPRGIYALSGLEIVQ